MLVTSDWQRRGSASGPAAAEGSGPAAVEEVSGDISTPVIIRPGVIPDSGDRGRGVPPPLPAKRENLEGSGLEHGWWRYPPDARWTMPAAE